MISPGSQIKGVIEYVLNGGVISVLIPVIGLGALMLWRNSKKNALVMVLWTLIALLIVIVQNRFFNYQWVLIYPPIAVFCAVGFHKIFFPNESKTLDAKGQFYQPLQILGALLLAVIIFQITIHPMVEVSNWISLISKRVSTEQYYAGFGSIPSSDIQAANYIRERTKEGDRIYIWGENASIYYLSSRQSSSRFGHSMPLLLGDGSAEREAYRRELLSSLASNPPRYIIIAPQSDLILGGYYDLSDFKELDEFVSTRYVEEKEFGDLVLYRLIEH